MKPKAKKTRQPADEVFRSLIKTMGLIRQVLRPHFDRHEIGRAQFMALANLCQAKEQGMVSLTIGELSARMIVRPPSMTGVVHKLHEMGLVEVRKSRADARSRDVSLTQKGWELRESMLDEHGREVGKLMGCLSTAEQEAMVGMLGKLAEHLIKIQKTAAQPEGLTKAQAGVEKTKGGVVSGRGARTTVGTSTTVGAKASVRTSTTVGTKATLGTKATGRATGNKRAGINS